MPPLPRTYHYAPPQRRSASGALMWVVLVLGFAATLFVGGILVMALAASPGQPSSTSPVATGPTTLESPSSAATSEVPGGAAPGGRGGGGSGSSVAAAANAATASPLYQSGTLIGFGCVGRQITPDSNASFEAFLNSTTDCLDRSWTSAFDRVGVPFTPPQRVFWSTPGRSPCGDYPAPGVAAFYCSLNNAMYIGVSGHAQESAGNLPVTFNVTYARNLAHEYSHHVQEMSGILEHLREQRILAETVEDRNAFTRRSELQAQCFTGAFMAAVRTTFPVTMQQWAVTLRDSRGRGDIPTKPLERDHGTGAHYAGWLERGFARGRLGACNTWSAPLSLVS